MASVSRVLPQSGSAAVRLAGLLAGRGDLDEAVQILRARADADDLLHLLRLAEPDELRARVDTGDLLHLLWLIDRLAERGDLDGLRARADAGDGRAAELANVLIKQGRGEEAKRLRRFGLNPDGSIACA